MYRPIRVYVGGEVKRPGYYTLSGNNKETALSRSIQTQQLTRRNGTNLNRPNLTENPLGTSAQWGGDGQSPFADVFPTVFDAIRSAQGITPYSNLSQVQVVRKRAKGLGGGRIKTDLNFLSLITEGDESQNIRLSDGDVLNIGKSPVVLRDQLLKAGQSNLSPQFIGVFVTGRVREPGQVLIPQGGTLNQAISLAGGTKFLKGKVEFVRFQREGAFDRRIFSYNPAAKSDTHKNPILASGDLIRVNDSLVSGAAEILNEVSAPFIGVYSIYSLFNEFSQ